MGFTDIYHTVAETLIAEYSGSLSWSYVVLYVAIVRVGLVAARTASL
jgi:hypothetical protein